MKHTWNILATVAAGLCLSLLVFALMRPDAGNAHVFGQPLRPATVRPKPPGDFYAVLGREALAQGVKDYDIVRPRLSYDAAGNSFFTVELASDGARHRVMLINRPGSSSWSLKEFEELPCDAASLSRK